MPPYRDYLRLLLAAVAGGLLIGHSLCPEHVHLDSQSLVLVGLLIVIVALPLLKEASFLGMKIKLKEAQNLAGKLRGQEPPGEPPAGGHGGTPLEPGPLGPAPPSMRALASDHPALAATAIRRDLEESLRNAFTAFSGQVPPDDLPQLVDGLTAYGLLSTDAGELALRLADIANTAIHSPREATSRNMGRLLELRDVVIARLSAGPARSAIEFEEQVWRLLRNATPDVERDVSLPNQTTLDFVAQIGDRTLGVEALYIPAESEMWPRRLRERFWKLPDFLEFELVVVIPDAFERAVHLHRPVSVLTISELARHLRTLSKDSDL